jgi:hypothetical protein
MEFHNKLKNNKKRIGIIGVPNDKNVGNLLVKFSMFIKLKELGFVPTSISLTYHGTDINFLKKTVNLIEIKRNFNEVNLSNFDYLMVNSDQTWNSKNIEYLYDQGFLRFAKESNINKFIYGASLGVDFWRYSKEFDKNAKLLLKNFTGVSVRERGAVDIVYNHLGIKPLFVLDPTFLIDKNYYLNILVDYKGNIDLNNKYLLVYILDENELLKKFIEDTSKVLNYKIFKVNINEKNYTENFIFGINISNAVITDSFHGTIFSIIFNKPFLSFINSNRGKLRFDSLIETFGLNNRINFFVNISKSDIELLTTPLNINQTLLKYYKELSINYLKKNLGII